eukprot:gnl/MRDRNA2_/MRDRNA2_55272_c0_seq1.p1 gnl/MRDRNA2_/MRDRNA2_55272_c0~~gnl/MRDRNA2_/MRDRNA2_55272_c0_seq1.p1  ORF type:complete len:141 (-),score=27.79 gnl/MRDRNA2_/MRDRNA2_55272_c0_seq1:13-435(-)
MQGFAKRLERPTKQRRIQNGAVSAPRKMSSSCNFFWIAAPMQNGHQVVGFVEIQAVDNLCHCDEQPPDKHLQVLESAIQKGVATRGNKLDMMAWEAPVVSRYAQHLHNEVKEKVLWILFFFFPIHMLQVQSGRSTMAASF